MSGFLNDELWKKTTLFGLRLWVALGIYVGAAVSVLLFIVSLWLISRRIVRRKIAAFLPHTAPPVVSKEILEIRVDPPDNLKLSLRDQVLEPEPLEKDSQKPGGIRRNHRCSERVGSCGGSSYGSGDQAAPEVSHLGWGHWYTLRELEVSTNGFSDENVIGEGGYGIVYHGVLEDGTMVAVKNLLNNRGQAEKEFKVEVEAIGQIRHKNLVRLLGYCAEGVQRILVYEYVDNGNMEQWLHRDVGPHSPLTWEIRMNIVLGVSKGLSYLHDGLEPKVIHRDIKSSNILLDKQWNPKLSDFGLAKLLCSEKSYITTRVMGTFGYVAPEYASTGMLNERSDVYSFGILVMEMIAGRSPIDYSRPSAEVNLVEWVKSMVSNRNVEGVWDPKLEEKPSSRALKRILLVALRCVDPNAQKRPNMAHVLHTLEADDFPLRDDRRSTGRDHTRSDHECDSQAGATVEESSESDYHKGL